MYSFYVKTIETHARAFLTLNILAIGRVLPQSIETLHNVQKLAKSGVPYIHILDITGGIYFICNTH